MSFSKTNPLFISSFIIIILSKALFGQPIRVVYITEDFASIAKSIGGQFVQVETLISGSQNLHHITPKPSMVIKVRNADLILRIGMGQDKWIDELIQAARKRTLFSGQLGHLNGSDKIRKLDIPSTKLNKSMGDIHKEGNPHYWLNPSNGLIIGNEIRKRLSILMPENASTFDQNYTLFSKQLKRKIHIWKNQIKPIKDAKFVTYHKVWEYFFEHYELQSLGQLEPVPGVPPSTKHLAKIQEKLNKVKTKKIIITANYYPQKAGKTVAKNTRSNFKKLPTNVGEFGTTSYIELFDYIITKITK